MRCPPIQICNRIRSTDFNSTEVDPRHLAADALAQVDRELHADLGGFLRQMKGRLGVQVALTATAHKLTRIVYLALKHGMTYVRQNQEEYEAQMKEKQVKALRRKARHLGLEVVEKTSGSVPTATAASVQGWRGKKGKEVAEQGAAGRTREGRGRTAGRAGH